MKLKDVCSLKKSYDRPRNSILKNRDITLLTNIRLVKAMVFPVVMYGCESCIIKKAEHPHVRQSLETGRGASEEELPFSCFRVHSEPLEQLSTMRGQQGKARLG